MIPAGERWEKVQRYPSMFSRIIVAGIDVDKLLDKTALVCGAGGLGVIVAEILARTGIGRLIIIDKDTVGEENFNRLGFNAKDIGKKKASVLAKRLLNLRNSGGVDEWFELKVEAYCENVIAWEKLEGLISRSDLAFTCFDNLDARLEVNFYAIKYRVPIFDGGTSTDGLRGTVTTVIPGVTPCIRCYNDPSTTISLEWEKPPGECGASLATTMCIVASFQVDPS
ncbi:MAG: ThiF family adenylyltransferase [Candidatus Freyarchaeota archaeon]|nr:ThiF family adenylyltransferase [Candidatus Jordarchaeia archaeon]